MRRMLVLCACVLALSVVAGYAEESAGATSPPLFSLSLAPSLDVPLGANAELFTLGPGGALSAELRMPFLPLLFAQASVGYSWVPLNLTTLSGSMSLIGGELVAGVHWDVLPALSLRAFAGGGYYVALLHADQWQTGSNGLLGAGVDVSYALLPSLALGIGASYRSWLGLYDGLSITLGASYRFDAAPAAAVQKQQPAEKPQPLEETPRTQPAEKPAAAGKGLELQKVQLSNLYPAFYKHYNTNPVGTAVLHNGESSEAQGIKVSFLVKQYMDNPKAAKVPATLAPGEEAAVELYGLFTNKVLEITEPTLVSASITVEYTLNGKTQTQEFTETLRFNNRNAMSWEDTERAASFVTTRDPSVLKFSRNVTALLKGKADPALNAKMLGAIGLHEALRLYGVEYVVDPTSPFSEMSQKKDAVDFLQFPQQTLEYKAGDCDDLSILYAALLESIGVETAFVTIPGHIYVAFSLDMAPDDARKLFQSPDDLIFLEGKSWVPVEVTVRDGDFLSAWADGAKEWRENRTKNVADLLPLHKAWQRYEAVGFSSAVVAMDMPSNDSIVKAYLDETRRFIDHEISARVTTLQNEIKKAADPSRSTNRLGVLYGQYGLYDLAEAQFTKLADKEYVPALLNLGNIWYVRGDPKKALTYYLRARKKDPTNAIAVLGVARTNHDQENYGEARTAYAALKELDSELAAQYAFLDLRGDESTRAEDASQTRGVMVWADSK